jgi:hypothetical protein
VDRTAATSSQDFSGLPTKVDTTATHPPSPAVQPTAAVFKPKKSSRVPSQKIKTIKPLPQLPDQPTLYKYFISDAPLAITAPEQLDTWGHTMDPIDPQVTFRVLLQNLNGIKPFRSDMDFQCSLAACAAFGIGTISLVETKLNWHLPGSISNTKHWFHRTWASSVLQPLQGPETFTSICQPGGTLTAVMDRWSSRTQDKGEDPYWSYITLRGRDSTLVTIISAYRVSQRTSVTTGVKTAYMQQCRTLLSKSNTTKTICSSEPNKQFITDLQSWIQLLQKQHHLIILSLDNNED